MNDSSSNSWWQGPRLDRQCCQKPNLRQKRAFKDYEANTTNKMLFGHCQSMHNQLSVTIEYLGRLLLLHIRQI